MARICILPVILLLAGCATTELPPVERPKALSLANGPDTATIFLNRENGGPLATSVAKITLDGKEVGTITNGQCIRLTVPTGSHNLRLNTALFGGLVSGLGNALAKSLNVYNVKISKGEIQHFFGKAHYDSPQVGWLFRVTRQDTGKTC